MSTGYHIIEMKFKSNIKLGGNEFEQMETLHNVGGLDQVQICV